VTVLQYPTYRLFILLTPRVRIDNVQTSGRALSHDKKQPRDVNEDLRLPHIAGVCYGRRTISLQVAAVFRMPSAGRRRRLRAVNGLRSDQYIVRVECPDAALSPAEPSPRQIRRPAGESAVSPADTAVPNPRRRCRWNYLRPRGPRVPSPRRRAA